MLRRWLAIALLLLVGCAGSQPALSSQQVATRAATAMSSVKTTHFVINMTGKLTYIDTNGVLGLKQAEGDVVAPDKVRATVKTSTFGIASQIGVVGIGDQRWATNPLNGRWQVLSPELGSFDLAALFDPQVGITGLLKTAPWQLEASKDGRYHLRSTVDGTKLVAMTSGMITKGQVDVLLLVDAKSFLVTSATLVERDTSPDQPTTWQIALTVPTTPVTIAPPPLQ
ncbi:MAG: LppX_LprAFG lipoprotein [Herpetosiphonaceae bacterium]|nr:LppX_LprAFG lipoprotein [Herpetosiphonaceae bacterium]